MLESLFSNLPKIMNADSSKYGFAALALILVVGLSAFLIRCMQHAPWWAYCVLFVLILEAVISSSLGGINAGDKVVDRTITLKRWKILKDCDSNKNDPAGDFIYEAKVNNIILASSCERQKKHNGEAIDVNKSIKLTIHEGKPLLVEASLTDIDPDTKNRSKQTLYFKDTLDKPIRDKEIAPNDSAGKGPNCDARMVLSVE